MYKSNIKRCAGSVCWKRQNTDFKQQRDIPCAWIGRLGMVKMPFLPKMICRFNTFPLTLTGEFFDDIGKLTLRCVYGEKGTE